MLTRLMSKGEYLIVPKGTKFEGSGKLGLMVAAGFDPQTSRLRNPCLTAKLPELIASVLNIKYV